MIPADRPLYLPGEAFRCQINEPHGLVISAQALLRQVSAPPYRAARPQLQALGGLCQRPSHSLSRGCC